MYIYKKNLHSCKYQKQGTEDKRRRNRGWETEKQRTVTVEKSHRKGTLGQLIGVRGRRKEDGRQGTDHVRQGKEDGRQGAKL
jgi:hypothetical protein